MDLEEQIELLEAALPRMNQYDRRMVSEWRARLNDQEVFDRQDRREIAEMVDGL